MLMIKLSYGSFHCLLQCVLPNLPIKAIQIIPNISLDEGYAVLCHLIEIRAVGGDPDPLALIQVLIAVT